MERSQEVVQKFHYAHVVGTARLGTNQRACVAEKFPDARDLSNRFVCDGSVLPAQKATMRG
jgi:choline dehydrogenase-like flavoprotein